MRPILLLLISSVLLACSSNNSGSGTSRSDPTDSPHTPSTPTPSNDSCIATLFETPAEIRLSRVYENLSFSSPILMLQASNQNQYWYIVEKSGAIYRIDHQSEQRNLVINISASINLSNCSECGLLGMSFHPDFMNNGYIYLSYTENRGNNMYSVISRFTSHDNGQSIDSGTRNDIFEVLQPYSNHNGGHIEFGADGFLYFGSGDGGLANDPQDHGQDTNTPLGAMLRMQDDGSPAPGNTVAGDARIYAYGLRNPWRWSFDRDTGDLWLGDVGQDAYEEINIITLGGNFGWRCYEGLHETANSCSSSGPFIQPVAEYGHDEGFSVTGGYVYRGDAIPTFDGVYLFADFGSGRIWGLFQNNNSGYDRRLLLDTDLSISSFGQGNNGELYIIDYAGGLYRIEADTTAIDDDFPALLSETGCVNPSNPAEAATGLIPYDLIVPFWSDNAAKQRFLALPDINSIQVESSGDMIFPIGTIFLKVFRLNDRLIETRLWMHHADGYWRGYSYQWNDAQTDASLVAVDGLDRVIGNQTWHYPSRAECDQCHTNVATFALGPEISQLNFDYTNPSSGETQNQIDNWVSMQLFQNDISDQLMQLRLTDPSDTAADLNDRAKSYLHSNCANCHQAAGPTNVNLDLRYTALLPDMNICNELPQSQDLGINNARIVAPGDSARSTLFARMNTRGQFQMPPSSSNVIDSGGVALIENWINNLESCN